MEPNFEARTGREIYPDVVDFVARHGWRRTVRGRETRDIGFTSILLGTPLDAMPLGIGRNLNPAIGAAEALQLIGAFSDPALMVKIAPAFKNYMNGDGFHGAYGSRIRHQMLNVASKLQREESTRQAIVTLWDPVLDNIPDMADYPCTIMLQFQVEDGQLCMNVVMRSNDVWLGLPYDMFQFTQLQMTLARSLGLAWGWYRHTALSLHIYEDDLEAADGIVLADDGLAGPFQPLGLGFLEKESFSSIMKRCRRLVSGQPVEGMTRSEVWYRDQLSIFAASS